MAWVIFNSSRLTVGEDVTHATLVALLGRILNPDAMHRGLVKSRPLFPIPLGEFAELVQVASDLSMSDFVEHVKKKSLAEEVWVCLSVCALNGVAGGNRATLLKQPSVVQRRALVAIRCTVQEALKPTELIRSLPEIEKELASRYLSYTGEEIPKMQVVSLKQIKPALPPIEHGGSIEAVRLVSRGTKEFLLNPRKSLKPCLKEGVKPCAKVHIQSGEELEVFKLLVERKICVWVRDEDVVRVEGKQILNGMFAVGKSAFLETGEEIQRLIMNLVPCNAVLEQIQGATSELPGITQYLSMVLAKHETLELFQSDMSSAFYLFKIPTQWSEMMTFNASFLGAEIGLEGEGSGRFRPACSVIPMGWGSAVSVMQEIAERLTTLARLPPSHRIRRTSPLPGWLVDVAAAACTSKRAWYHVYLDNFCAMEKVVSGEVAGQGKEFHEKLEEAWDTVGVLSSAKKRVSRASAAQELGAMIEGNSGTLGPSTERILKLVQTTLLVISKMRLKKKWVQVVAGRWVHVLSFRRPGMSLLDKVWKFISGTTTSVALEAVVRGELWSCCCAALLLHTNLRAQVSEVTTASDASMSGGAVGMSEELTEEGRDFASAGLSNELEVKTIPVLLLSLFNGMGCCFRCYDLCGVVPLVAVSYEISKSGNRVTSRRWPNVIIEKDVKDLTEQVVDEWIHKYPEVLEIHVWGGFPCIDLSSVKWGRQNLEGPQSKLFYEFVRVIKLLRRKYGFSFPVKFLGENVASMDYEAERTITATLGVKPVKVDSVDAVPIHRPRFCWHNLEYVEVPGVYLEECDRWILASMPHAYPELSQWLEAGAVWPGFDQGAVFPTCMKSIKRKVPPPRPAGIDRVGIDARQRWEADDFRYPPYQYDDRFVIWVENRWRLLSIEERELLHGLGYGHTKLCWNAGDIKQDPIGYDDARKSLVGDGFNCFSFCYFAALAVKKWQPNITFGQLWNRMGLAPGFLCGLDIKAPMTRRLSYGSTGEKGSIRDLHLALLRRVNHTGSDVRVSSGIIVNPKSFPRQGVEASWWKWKKVFANRWARADHINSLEMRAIIQALEWRVKHLQEFNLRVFHLTDSYVCMSIIAKGRTSSKMLMPLVRRLSALLLAFGLQLVITHVESTENPTDEASRQDQWMGWLGHQRSTSES